MERGERERTAATERGVLGRRKEEGGVSRRLAGIQREERKEVGEGMYDTIRYNTKVYLPSFPPVPVNKIPKKYRPIPNRNTDTGCNPRYVTRAGGGYLNSLTPMVPSMEPFFLGYRNFVVNS